MKRPFVFVNLAMSADGKLSTRERRQVRISGRTDFLRVDVIKAESDAIMVGIGTVLADDPSLTVKSPELKSRRVKAGKEENPTRIVVDSMARLPVDADILHKGSGMRIVAVSREAPADKLVQLRPFAKIIVAGENRVDLPELFEQLCKMGIGSLMVEGGGQLIWSLFEKGLVDELYTYIGNIVIGGRDAPTPADGSGFVSEKDFPGLELIDMDKIDDGALLRWKVL